MEYNLEKFVLDHNSIISNALELNDVYYKKENELRERLIEKGVVSDISRLFYDGKRDLEEISLDVDDFDKVGYISVCFCITESLAWGATNTDRWYIDIFPTIEETIQGLDRSLTNLEDRIIRKDSDKKTKKEEEENRREANERIEYDRLRAKYEGKE